MSARQKKVEQLRDRRRANALELLCERFCLPALAAVIQRGDSNSTYELKLEDGGIVVLGGALEVHQQAKVRARLFDVGVRLPKYDARAWDEVLDAFLAVVEKVSTFSEAEELRNYVIGYTTGDRTHGLLRLNARDQLEGLNMNVEEFRDEQELLRHLRAKRYNGYVDERRVYLPLNNFTMYVNHHRGGRYSERDMAEMLSRHGFEYRQKTVPYSVKSGDGTTVRRTVNVGRFWRSPEGYLDEPEASEGAQD